MKQTSSNKVNGLIDVERKFYATKATWTIRKIKTESIKHRPLTIFLHQYNISHVFDLIRTNEHNFNESELVKM